MHADDDDHGDKHRKAAAMTPGQHERQLWITCAADKLSATLHYAPTGEQPDSPEHQIRALIHDCSIASEACDEQAIAHAAEQIGAAPDAPLTAVIAAGKAPVHGEDGRFDLETVIAEQLDTINQQRGFAKDPPAQDDGKSAARATDHYNRSAFVVVAEGQRIGTKREPVEGTDGTDIYGNPIPARAPKSCSINFDASVVIDDDGAVRAGSCGVLKATSIELRVSPDLEIRNNVDFSTGNIDFPGDVTVREEVRDCFVVRAGRDLRVVGLVEDATLRVGRDCKLDCGMAARERGTIQIGRDLVANYLHNVEGLVTRNCAIARELNSCQLRIGGRLDAPDAVIIGGDIEIGGQTEVAQIGSENEAITGVRLGRLPLLESHTAEALLMHEKLAKEQASIIEKIQRVKDAQGPKKSSAGAEEITRLMLIQSTYKARAEAFNETLERVALVFERFAIPSLIVRKMLHIGVIINLGGFECVLTKGIKGPVRIEMHGEEPVAVDHETGASQPLERFATITTDPHAYTASSIRGVINRAA